MQEKSCRFPSMIWSCCCPTFSHANISFIIAAMVLWHCTGESQVPTNHTHPWTPHLHLHHIWPGQLEIQPWEMAVCIQHPERSASAWWLVDFLVLGSFFPLAKQQCLWPGKQGEDQVLRWSCPPSQADSAQSTGCPTHSAVTTTQLCIAEQDVMRFPHPLTWSEQTVWHEINN